MQLCWVWHPLKQGILTADLLFLILYCSELKWLAFVKRISDFYVNVCKSDDYLLNYWFWLNDYDIDMYLLDDTSVYWNELQTNYTYPEYTLKVRNMATMVLNYQNICRSTYFQKYLDITASSLKNGWVYTSYCAFWVCDFIHYYDL